MPGRTPALHGCRSTPSSFPDQHLRSIRAEASHVKRERSFAPTTSAKCDAFRRNFDTLELFSCGAYLCSIHGDSFMKTYITLVAAALVSTAAFAQQEPQNPPASTNAATSPPPASASPALAQIFDQLDTNHD